MNRNRVMWGIVALVVLMTIVISAGISNRRGQAMFQAEVSSTPPLATTEPNFSKYSEVDYDGAPDGLTASQIEERRIKNKRYDTIATVLANPPHDAERIAEFDVEPYPSALPESRLVVVGSISNSRAFLSNEKKGVYAEYRVTVEKILKPDEERKLKSHEVVFVDRPGGVVRYSTGQRILYTVDGQPLPEGNGRYLFFLGNDDPKNPNYKILNAYRLTGGKVVALDRIKSHDEFNGKTEADFLRFVVEKMKSRGTNHEQ